jgi:predicted phosphodiesterase
MRALVISDIHANLPALEVVLAAASPYDAVWNLGDIVGYGANLNEVVDLEACGNSQ